MPGITCYKFRQTNLKKKQQIGSVPKYRMCWLSIDKIQAFDAMKRDLINLDHNGQLNLLNRR